MRRYFVLASGLLLGACGDGAFGSDESFVPLDGGAASDGSMGATRTNEVSGTVDPAVALAEVLEHDVAEIAQPEPLLPYAARDALVLDLSAADFSALCEPYLDNAVTAAHNAVGLCALRGLAAAEDARTSDVEGYQAACRDGRGACEREAAERNSMASLVGCERASSCSITVGDVDQCHGSLMLLDLAILAPSASWPIPSCDALTPEVGRSLHAEIRGVILQAYREFELGSVVEACAGVHAHCASIAVPLPISGG